MPRFRYYWNVFLILFYFLLNFQCNILYGFQISRGFCSERKVNLLHSRISRNLNRLDLSRVSVSDFNRRKESFEDVLYLPPNYIIDCLDKHSSKRLTVADVATLTGASFSKAKRDIMILAFLSNAVIQVSKDGELYFKFPQNFKEIISQRSFRYRLNKNLNKYIYPVLDQLVRIGVGSVLVISLTLVAITLIFASVSVTSSSSTSSSSRSKKEKEKDKEKEKERHYHHHHYYDRYYRSPMNIHFLFDLNDLFFLFSRGYRSAVTRPYSTSSSLEPQQPKMNFLESCFSFLFGDGNPNIGYEEKLSAEAANFIRSKGGIVVAEQLVKFLPEPPTSPSIQARQFKQESEDESSSFRSIDESYVLPLLIKFNGNQIVTKEGIILYQFEELMQSDSLRNDPEQQRDQHPTLLENKISFSQAKNSQIMLVACLGVANFLGIDMLSTMLRSHKNAPFFSHFPGSFLKQFFPFFKSYAYIFLGLPIVRMMNNWIQNRKINDRNKRRVNWLSYLQNWKENPSLAEKLQVREEYLKLHPPSIAPLSSKNIGYDSSKNLLDQQFENYLNDDGLDENF